MALAVAGSAQASGTAFADPQVLADPSLANGPVFKASMATAGTAVVSAVADGPLVDCSRKNPCATPAPARDQVVVIPSRTAGQVDPVHFVKPGKLRPAVAAQPGPRSKATS